MADNQETVFDTDQQQVGLIYAKALLAVASKSDSVDQIVGELGDVVGVVNSLPQLKSTLESPRIAASEKANLVEKAVDGKVAKDLVNFLKIVCEKGRFDCLNALLGCARKMRDEMAGEVQATVTTAEQIDDSVKGRIADELSKSLGKKVHLAASVDPGILGGMVVRVGDTVYDGSVVSQLAQVRSQAVKRATDAIRTSIEKFTSS